jgi:hypothetical protein
MPRIPTLAILSLAVATADVRADDAKKAAENAMEVAGKAEFLRGVPKHFALLKAVEASNRRVTLLIEGDKMAKSWPVIGDAEIKIAGWWGRLEQFTLGDRVWVWFKTDRAKQPVAVAMIADEPSEQDMHGAGMKLEAKTAEDMTLKPTKGANRVVNASKALVFCGAEKSALADLEVGKPIYTQTADGKARFVLDTAAFEERRSQQKTRLRQRWSDEGLPGAVAFTHTFSGELDFMVDHEGMRWARSLKTGDKVELTATPPIPAVVKLVRPWRERTEVRLVVDGFQQAELTAGQRLHLKMTPPSLQLDTDRFPPDMERPREKTERVEWFLSSIYCTCKIEGDGCTGMFYTLAGCNPNGCGMPNYVRKIIAGKIDKGLTDRQIFEELLKDMGPDLLRPHLMP